MNDFQLGFAKKVKAPVIVVASMPPNQLLNPLIGNPLEVAYVPSINDSVEKGKALTFRQRLTGYVSSVFFEIFSCLSERRNRNLYK